MEPSLKRILNQIEGNKPKARITISDKKGGSFSEEIVAKLPKVVNGKDGRDGIDGKDGRDGKDGINGKDGKNGSDGKDGRDGLDGVNPDPNEVAVTAINLLESYEGDARLSARALRDFEELVNEILDKGIEPTFTESQIQTIKDLLPKYPPINAGGSGATFLKSLRDVDLSGLTKNAEGKYVLSTGSSADTFETVSKNLDASNATLNYSGSTLTSIDYANGITKTLNYTGSTLTSVVLSGSTPSGISLTKTLNYTGSTLTGVTYS